MVIDILDRDLQFIGTIQGIMEEEQEDSTDKVYSTISFVADFVNDNNDIDFETSVRKRFFVFYETTLAMIEDYQVVGKDGTMKISRNGDMLEFDVLVESQAPLDIELFIKNKLEEEFVTNTFLQARIPIVVNNITSTFDTIIAPDKVLAFGVLSRQVLRKNNIKITTTLQGLYPNEQIVVDIEAKPFNVVDLDETYSSILSNTKRLDSEEATKLTIFNGVTSYQFFLKTNGRVTTNPNDIEILLSSVDKKIYDEDITTSDEALAKAREELERVYNNNITMEVTEELYHHLSLNDDVAFQLLNRNTIDTKVSKKIRKNNSFTVILGTSRTRLTDILRRRR